MKIFDTEKSISKLCDDIRILSHEKERKLKRFSLLRDHVSINISIVESQLEECLTSKTSYEKFHYANLQACEIASYGLCALLSVSDAIKKSWEKEIERKGNFAAVLKCFL